MSDVIQPNHKRRVRTYSILHRVFLPVGIVLLALGVLMLGFGIYFMVTALASVDAASCVQSAYGTRCTVEGEAAFALTGGIVLLVFGILGLSFGTPLFVLNFVFGSLAKKNRAADETAGVDYSDFPYGK